MALVRLDAGRAAVSALGVSCRLVLGRPGALTLGAGGLGYCVCVGVGSGAWVALGVGWGVLRRFCAVTLVSWG